MSHTYSPHRHPHRLLAAPSNGLGTAGFVCSLIGLVVTGGVLCPIGLILSLVALGRQPRGLAIAGVILGLIGSCGVIAVLLLAGGVIIAAIAAAVGISVLALTLSEPNRVELTADMANIAVAVETYREDNRYLPAGLDMLGISANSRIDPWGKDYQYMLIEEKPGYEIISAGVDGKFGSPDDVKLSTLGDEWSATGGSLISVSESADGGSMEIKLGDRTINVEGDGHGGSVTVDLGDRTLHIVGDNDGGRVEVVPDSPSLPSSTNDPTPAPPAVAPATPETPASPSGASEPAGSSPGQG